MSTKYRKFQRILVSPWFLILVFWVLLLIVLLRVLVVAASSSAGIDGADSGGQIASFVLFFVALVPLFVSTLTFVVPRIVPWIAGIVSVVLASLLTLLIQVGLDNVAWSLYGGLKVGRASEVFNDLAWTLRWVACEGCEANATNHGVGLLWLKPLTLGQVSGEWAIPLGFLGILVMSLALVWLAKESLPIGTLLISLAAVSSAWLLLLDRINLDIIVFLLPLAGVLLYRRSSGFLAWTTLAVLVWWVGTWKYYPFVLGIVLLPALRLKRGWVILLSYLGATLLYLALQASSIMEDLAQNSIMVYLENIPAFGRIPIIARITSDFVLGQEPLWPNLLLLLLGLVALAWGLRVSRRLETAPMELPLMAFAGSLIFLINTFVAGFGFGYKGAFLLLTIPLVAFLIKKPDHLLLYTGLVLICFLSLSLFVSHSILLTSLVSIFGSFIILGLSIGLIVSERSKFLGLTRHANAT